MVLLFGAAAAALVARRRLAKKDPVDTGPTGDA
jgi:hypothetical protein